MASKNKAAKAGAGAYAAGKAVRSNEYVQRLIEDAELRENLRSAFVSSKKAYGRINGKGPAKAMDDKKVKRDLKDAASNLKDAADSLRGKKKRTGRKRRLLLLALVGAVAAVALSEDLRKKVLDAVFGAEEEFEYTATTTPDSASSQSSSSSGSDTGSSSGSDPGSSSGSSSGEPVSTG